MNPDNVLTIGQVIGIAASIIGVLCAVIVKQYLDNKGLHKTIQDKQDEYKNEAKANTEALIETHNKVHDYIDKIKTLFDASRRGGRL